MVSLIRGLFGQALKTNEFLQFAVLTGCLRVSKESIFTGLNNFEINSIVDIAHDEQFGFTDDEVRKLLLDYDRSERYPDVKEWYDGYHFGNTDIYCSASFLNENFDWKKLKNCKVWVASYSDTRPKLPVSADLWQYTKKGSLEGANTDKGYCDLVYSYMEATSIKFTKPTLTMKKNTTAQATVKIKPNGCTDRKSFTSSNPKVVAVNKKTGKLTAKKAGKATITVTTGSGRKAKMKVVVK